VLARRSDDPDSPLRRAIGNVQSARGAQAAG
jgi:hypothetical protein